MRSSNHLRRLRSLTIVSLLISANLDTADADERAVPPTEASQAAEAYPAQLSLRPLTLPGGMTEAAMRGGHWWIEDEPNIAPLSVGARVGITDRWQASAFTSIPITPETEWRNFVGISTKLLAYDSARTDIAPGISAPINFDQDQDAHIVPAVTIDATTRIHITKRYSLIFGDGLVPLRIGRRASMNLNVSVIVQSRPDFGMRLSSQLFHLRLSGDVPKTTPGRFAPALTVFHSIGNWIDLSATAAIYNDAVGLFGRVAIRR